MCGGVVGGGSLHRDPRLEVWGERLRSGRLGECLDSGARHGQDGAHRRSSRTEEVALAGLSSKARAKLVG